MNNDANYVKKKKKVYTIPPWAMGTTSYNSNNEHTVNYVQCQQAPL